MGGEGGVGSVGSVGGVGGVGGVEGWGRNLCYAVSPIKNKVGSGTAID
ncbi:MAG: hypothetical protein RMX35_28405 [Nostoc sp. DcaGUA01]|nr:hypothetical protein [Nostoc sp. DcaGUA01]